MSWSIEDIENNLLLGKIDVLALAPESVVAAVNRVEDVLGPKWIASDTSAKGIAPALRIIGVGQRLAALEGIAQPEELLRYIRRRDQNAEAELTAIYLIRPFGLSVELELHPKVDTRKADFRVKKGDEQWTTVEVTQPNTSQEQRRVERILRRLTDAFNKTDRPFALEILLRREPTEEEVALLCHQLPEFCMLPGQHRAELMGGMVLLFLDHVQVGNLLPCEVPEFADTPMIGLAMFAAGGAGGGPQYQVSVRMPFTDERAEEVLRKEARQLPQNGAGLVMIAIPSSTRNLKPWVSLIEGRLRPDIHTRVSAVCLFDSGMVPVEKRYDWLLQTKLITNPYARFQLPTWIQAAVTSAGHQFERVASQWEW